MAKGFTPKEKNLTSAKEPKYNILENSTMGFSVVFENLTKSEAQNKINEMTNDGVNPERIKIQRVS
jgi:hypothetical protein